MEISFRDLFSLWSSFQSDGAKLSVSPWGFKVVSSLTLDHRGRGMGSSGLRLLAQGQVGEPGGSTA